MKNESSLQKASIVDTNTIYSVDSGGYAVYLKATFSYLFTIDNSINNSII